MGLGSRIILGSFCLMGGVMMLSVSSMEGVKNPIAAYAIAGFCFLIAIGCIGGKAGHVSLRVVSAVVFLACCGYVYEEFTASKQVWLTGRQSEPSIVNSLIAFVIFGIPAGLFAIKGWSFKLNEDDAALLAFETTLEDAARPYSVEWIESYADDDLSAEEGLGLRDRDLSFREIGVEEAETVLDRLLGGVHDMVPPVRRPEIFRQVLERLETGRDADYFEITSSGKLLGLMVVGHMRHGALMLV